MAQTAGIVPLPSSRFVVVRLLSCVRFFVTLWTATHQDSLSFTIFHRLLKLMSFESVMPSKILSSVVPFSCLQSFPASGSFSVSQLFALGGQIIGASASATVLPMNIHGWFPFGLTALISLLSNRVSRVFSNTTVQKHQFFGAQPVLWSNSQICTWLLEKPWFQLDRSLSAKRCLWF